MKISDDVGTCRSEGEHYALACQDPSSCSLSSCTWRGGFGTKPTKRKSLLVLTQKNIVEVWMEVKLVPTKILDSLNLSLVIIIMILMNSNDNENDNWYHYNTNRDSWFFQLELHGDLLAHEHIRIMARLQIQIQMKMKIQIKIQVRIQTQIQIHEHIRIMARLQCWSCSLFTIYYEDSEENGKWHDWKYFIYNHNYDDCWKRAQLQVTN